MKRRHGPLGAVTDIGFDRWHTPGIVRTLYLAALLTIGGSGGFSALFWLWLSAWAGWAFAFLVPVTVVGCGAAALAVRIGLELALIRFVPPDMRYLRREGTSGAAVGAPEKACEAPSNRAEGTNNRAKHLEGRRAGACGTAPATDGKIRDLGSGGDQE